MIKLKNLVTYEIVEATIVIDSLNNLRAVYYLNDCWHNDRLFQFVPAKAGIDF